VIYPTIALFRAAPNHKHYSKTPLNNRDISQ